MGYRDRDRSLGEVQLRRECRGPPQPGSSPQSMGPRPKAHPCTSHRRAPIFYSGLANDPPAEDFALAFALFAERHPLQASWSLAVGSGDERCGVSIDNGTIAWLGSDALALLTECEKGEVLREAGDVFAYPPGFRTARDFQVLTVAPY